MLKEIEYNLQKLFKGKSISECIDYLKIISKMAKFKIIIKLDKP